MAIPRRFPRFPRWLRIVLCGVALLLVAAIAALSLGKERIVDEVEVRVRERLLKRGLEPSWSGASWSLLRGGVVFRDFRLKETEGDKLTILRMERFAARIPISRFLMPGHRTVIWSIPPSRVVVADEAGEIVLEDVEAEFRTLKGKILVAGAKATRKGLSVDLEGEITTHEEPQEPPKKFTMKLKAARATLGVLDFDEGAELFKVKGTFKVDATMPEFDWSASLEGDGKEVSLKGVPLRKAGASGEFDSTAKSVIKAGVSTRHGKAQAVISREGWKDSPFMFDGTLDDSEGRSDRFDGRVDDGVFLIRNLAGAADLWSIASDVPALKKGFPESLEMVRFPPVAAENIRRGRDGGWSVENASTTSDGAVNVLHEGKKVPITSLGGSTSFNGESWILRKLDGNVFGGRFSLKGRYSAGTLSDAFIKGDALKLGEIKEASGKGKSSTPGTLDFSYSGSSRFVERQFDGEGRMILDKAPVFEVPLLDQVHDLFAAILPGVERSESGEGRFEAHFTSKGNIVQVGSFEAKGGTLVVDARGEVDLVKESVSGSARGKLTGLPGVVTSPLSRLLEMEVSGSLDNIQVKRLDAGKIISNAATGTADVLKDAVEGTEEAAGSLEEKNAGKPKSWWERFRQRKDSDGKND